MPQVLLGASFFKKVGRVTKKAVTAPSKLVAKSANVVLKPVIGKKAARLVSKSVNVVANPYAQASLARKGTQAVIGKKAYRSGSKFVRSQAGNIAATGLNLFVPGAGTAALQASRTAKAGLRQPVVRKLMAKKAVAVPFKPTQSPREVIQDVVQSAVKKVIPVVPEEPVVEPANKNMPLIIGGIAIGALFLMSRKGR